jgi:hypothetical protein
MQGVVILRYFKQDLMKDIKFLCGCFNFWKLNLTNASTLIKLIIKFKSQSNHTLQQQLSSKIYFYDIPKFFLYFFINILCTPKKEMQ